jgi:hypothetical protein
LRIFIILFITTITLIGVLSQASASCASLESKPSVSLELQNYSSITNQSFPPQGQQTSAHHHAGSAHHNCHLGHCVFILSSLVALSPLSPDQILEFTDLSVVISDFPTSLFRPPIA